jgi:hypothetical protein
MNELRDRWNERLPVDHPENRAMFALAEQSAIEQAERNAAFDRLQQLDELRAFAEEFGVDTEL